MKNAAKRESQVIVLDYNLDDTRWEPEPPLSFLRLYRAFLDWRSANNWDNRMASNLAALFHSEGLIEVTEHPSDEVVQRAIPIFWTLTHLEFGSTSLRMLDQIWLKQAFLKKVPDVVPKKITGSMFAKRCACKHIRC
jgi:hypothetical protein